MDSYTSIKISSLAEEDRPREKLLLQGRAALTDAELIAILIGSGTRHTSAVDLAKNILASVDNDLGLLAKMTVKELQKFKGIGEAKAISIVSAMELGRRRKGSEPKKRARITSSSDVYEIMKPDLLDEPVEHFYVLLLNRSNHVIKKYKISYGGTSATIADPKMIFKIALEYLATAIVLVHNHPSGNLRPSQTDINLTKKLVEVGRNLDLTVIDHVIFTDVGYFSFADEAMI